MAVYNVESFLEDAIESLINQTIGFEEHIELILINDGSKDNSEAIALEYQSKYPNNIRVLSKENGGVASARNLGLKYVTGDYVNFMDSDDKISPESFDSVYKFFLNHKNEDFDVASIPIFFFESRSGSHPLNFKFKEDKVIDLIENPKYTQVVTNASFVKREALEGFEFDPKPFKMEDALFINKILLNKKKLGLVTEASYLYRKRQDGSSITTGDGKYKKEFYTGQLKYFYKELINYSIRKEGYLPEFIQHLFVYDLRWIVEVELSDIKNVFDSDEELEEFWIYLTDVLSYIDVDIIASTRVVPTAVRKFLIYVKNNDFHVELNEKNEVILMSNDFKISNLNKHNIWIDIVDLKDGFLNISGTYSGYCSNEFISIKAIKTVNGKSETYDVKYFDYYNSPHKNHRTLSYLSIPWKFTSSFDVKVPINDNELPEIYFNVTYNEDNNNVSFRPKLKFRIYANLSIQSHYYVKNSKIVLFKGPSSFSILPYSFGKHLKLELMSILSILRNSEYKFMTAIFFRLIFFVLYPFKKNKEIWLFMDRQENCGDNGLHFFEYVYKQDDNIVKYFTINKDSEDFPKLKEEYGKAIVPFGSFKHRLIFSFANKLISSHPDNNILNPFWNQNNRLYAGLKTSDLYFLQHGVGKYDMSRWIRKYDHNLTLLLTVSDLDYESFIKNYNYDDKIVQKLGFPRFDNLTNENLKKQVVILLTWRNFIINEESLVNSEFYSKIISLINNTKLINHAKEKGYDIVFKLHPLMNQYIDLFKKENDSVIFDNYTKYHDIICDSALMITDYSSVAFDFAYLKKPIIYYRYGNDYHFDIETCYFDDEKEGFGDIIKDEDVLVDKIIEYMDNDCKMEDFYKKRVDNFYIYTDKNNSKRVYDWMLDN